MDWVLRSPDMHNTFSNLGYKHADGYNINKNCNAALATILHNILLEDKYQRPYRRSIGFGQNVKKDLIPLLIYCKEDRTKELLIKILVNLAIPLECLFSVDMVGRADIGSQTIFDINNLLTSIKLAFTDQRVTKVVLDILKKNVELEQASKLSEAQCENINNCLLLLRNILHVTEEQSPNNTGHGPSHLVQNQILWNIFSQSVDKILIKLMTVPEAGTWSVTMVQVVALLYKDQHVVTLHKLLNTWLATSLSETSDDNESNTSPPDRSSEDSSMVLTSDSSDAGGSDKCNEDRKPEGDWQTSPGDQDQTPTPPPPPPSPSARRSGKRSLSVMMDDNHNHSINSNISIIQKPNNKRLIIKSETQESTSSNEDEVPAKKPVHQKPHNPKQRANTKARMAPTIIGKKRRKMVKRARANINVQGLSNKTPNDDDISKIIKEFTIEFLLKGYNSLVHNLHSQILSHNVLKADMSHFFWLVTYFLKFATQIELDLDHVNQVLSFDIVSFVTAEGANLCEQFELAIKLDGSEFKPYTRKLHLVVTAIREFVHAIEMYKKVSHMSEEDKAALARLQTRMCEMEELRALPVLLLRHYNPKYQTKQYLQDLIVTNHILILLLESVSKKPEYKGSTNIQDHIKQLATPAVMQQYGLLLESHEWNGEYVNDCVFTLMHHVAGQVQTLASLYQPSVLRAIASIWRTDFEICDDWNDLITYVVNSLLKNPPTKQIMQRFRMETEKLCMAEEVGDLIIREAAFCDSGDVQPDSDDKQQCWPKGELLSLNWHYVQCKASDDVIGDIVKRFKEDNIVKTRNSVINQLYKRNIIDEQLFNVLTQSTNVRVSSEQQMNEISKLCEQIIQGGRGKYLEWLQKMLLETCFAKIYVESTYGASRKIMGFEIFRTKEVDSIFPLVSPVAYHNLVSNESIPLVPYTCEQAAACKDLKFLQLLHKLGFQLPVDTDKVFIRIPYFWSASHLYELAGKIMPIDTTKLKFSQNAIASSSGHKFSMSANPDAEAADTPAPELYYQLHKQNHLANKINFTPMPGTSFNNEQPSSSSGEVNNQSWLNVVQRSQELKISMNMQCAGMEAGGGGVKVEAPGPASAAPPPPQRVYMPDFDDDTAMDNMDISPQTPADAKPTATGLPLFELEDNSVFESASIASNLTRMYVSDEDEKPEHVMRTILVPRRSHAAAADKPLPY